MSGPLPLVGAYCPDRTFERGIVDALAPHGFLVYGHDVPQDLCSALYRDESILGLVVRAGPPAFHMMTVAEFRRAGVKNPLLCLIEGSGDKAPVERADVLAAGADDVQPINIHVDELVARLKTWSWRGTYFDHRRIELPNCVYDDSIHAFVSSFGESIRLTPTEAKTFSIIARERGDCVSKEKVFAGLYDEPGEREIKIVDVMVCKIRRKFARASGGMDCIKTVWGRGYAFEQAGFEPEWGAWRTRSA